MKKCQYILFSAFLSLLIIYMGVGIPVVQYRCMKCMDIDKHVALLSIVEVSDSKCTCGCADGNNKCSCAVKKDVCCCGDETEGENPKAANCSQVRIEKLSLPTLAASIHLDDIISPIIDLFFNSFIIDADLYASFCVREDFADDSMYRRQSQDYLHIICTLLI